MAEWTKATVLKTVVGLAHRGFESLSLRLTHRREAPRVAHPPQGRLHPHNSGRCRSWLIGAAC